MTTLYEFLAAGAAVALLLAALATGLRPERGWPIGGWPIGGWFAPALVSLLFLGWSLYTVAVEGPWGFWPNHTQSAWGNQVWFDLLIAIGLAWALILPRARAVGMRPWPWLALILCTGCIGLAAMFARCRFLEARQSA